VIGVEPAAGDHGLRSFRSGRIETVPLPRTIADGARTMSLGKLTFALIRGLVDDFLTVTDDELLQSMFFLWERMKVVVEPTGALAACALLQGKIEAGNLRVGVVLSGGNVDLAWAAEQRLRSR
jgi:threonine dehydratase